MDAEAVTPQYKTVEPYTIKRFDYPPTRRQALSVKNIIRFYPFELQSICNRYNKTGRKILVVTDDFITYRERGDSDLDRGCIFSGEEGGVLQNIYAYCMGQTAAPDSIKEITTLNWAFGRLSVAAKSKGNAQTAQALETANRAFLRRLKMFIQAYEPDVVVLAGLDMAHYVLSNLRSDDQTNHRIYTNRLVKAEVGDHRFKIMGCIDVKRPCSWEGVTVKEEPSLIGFFCYGFIQALNGRNTYTLNLPDDIRFINVNTIERFDTMMRRMWRQRIVSIDTETDGLGRLAVALYTAQFCWDGKTGYVLPVDHPDTPFTVKERKYIKAKLKYYFEYGRSLYHIYQNGKFDIAVFYATLGMRHYNHRVYDIQAGEYAFDENKKLLAQKTLKYSRPHEGLPFKPYALDFIAESYGCKIYRNIEFSKGNRGKISTEGLTKRFIEYAAYDVIVPFHIQEIQIVRAKRARMRKFLKFVCEQLGDTVVACAGMEHVGAYVSKLKLFQLKDRNGPLRTLHDKLVKEYEGSEAAIQVNDYLKKKQGVPESRGVFRQNTWLFNIKDQRHQQLIFFKALGLEGLANKKDSEDFQVNAKFKKTYADVPDVQRFNDIIKVGTVSNTFIKPTYLKIVEDRDCSLDSHIRSVFDYIYVSSGRLSSSKPNLQNLPSRGELAKYVKDIYEAEQGTLIIENDYSAHEVREWGNEAQDTILCDTFYTALKYRQEFRILVSKYEENLTEWYAIKARVEWDKKVDKRPVHTYDDKIAIVRGINNPITREIGFAELELEAKGDIHKLNCVRFFSLNSPLEVTEAQRYEIKAIVFGTIYGKTAAGLAKPVAELGLGKPVEYCEDLIATLFKTFPDGHKFLLRENKFGRENLYVENKLGMQRHLWAYLHNRPAFLNGADRRGPNTILQGTASQIGITSIREMQRMMWHFFIKQGVDISWKTVTNYVHDSVKSQSPYYFIPVYLYMIEHASSTLIHRRYRELFDYQLKVGLELEFQIGPTLSTTDKWDFTSKNLIDTCEKSLTHQTEKLGHEVNIKKEMKTIKHNWNIIRDIRLRELEKSVKSKAPSEYMIMNRHNSLDWGLKLPHV